MEDSRQDEKSEEGPTLQVVSARDGGFLVGVADENGRWPFQSETFETRDAAEKKLAELNAPLPYEVLCDDCRAGVTRQEFLQMAPVAGLWACPCSPNSLLFPRSRTVEESVRRIQEFVAQRGS